MADCLHARGPSTLSELIGYIRGACLRDWNVERERLVDSLNGKVAGRKSGASATATSAVDRTEEDRNYYHGGRVHMNKARGTEVAGFITDAAHIRAALIVLLQHSLVGFSGGGSKQAKDQDVDATPIKPDPTSPSTHYTYTFLVDRAQLLTRYPRYIEHAKEMVDENASSIVEFLLVNGRMRGEDVIASVWEVVKGSGVNGVEGEDTEDSDGLESPTKVKSETNADDVLSSPTTNGDKSNDKRQKALVSIVKSYRKLVETGFIEMVKPIATTQDLKSLHNQDEKQDGITGGEVEFEMDEDGDIDTKKKRARSISGDRGDKKPKKQKVANGKSKSSGDDDNREDDYGANKPDNPQILSLLSPLRRIIPPGSVFRVNTSMFHSSIRAIVIGRLVSEMYDTAPTKKGTKSDSDDDNLSHVGAIVRAALTYAARQEHAPMDQLLGMEETEDDKHNRMADWGAFTPNDIIPYLPLEVTAALQSQVGGTVQNLSATLLRLSQFQYPPILTEVEDVGGHPAGGKFEISTRQLLQRMRDRILHRVLTTHHGLAAARIVSILQVKGHMESDSIAEDAMMPAKEAREILHRLHRDKFINLFDMHMTKQHNSGTAIYLWNVIPSRLMNTVVNNVYTAILHLRLRRQHEVEVGKDWMDRAKEAGATEENVHEDDKRKYHAFCKGLDRLDFACLQLDETLMVLKDF